MTLTSESLIGEWVILYKVWTKLVRNVLFDTGLYFEISVLDISRVDCNKVMKT